MTAYSGWGEPQRCGKPRSNYYFFFQAEDGVRGLVRSRGLGDVYKRQALMKSRKQPATSNRRIEPVTGLLRILVLEDWQRRTMAAVGVSLAMYGTSRGVSQALYGTNVACEQYDAMLVI